MLTGKIRAFVAETHKTFAQLAALSFVITAFASWQAASAVGLAKSLFLQVIFHGKIAGAYTTVHPARGY